jgi:hypothetical protein
MSAALTTVHHNRPPLSPFVDYGSVVNDQSLYLA